MGNPLDKHIRMRPDRAHRDNPFGRPTSGKRGKGNIPYLKARRRFRKAAFRG